jgi:drug/metabolite transporter (DMT)-like permease
MSNRITPYADSIKSVVQYGACYSFAVMSLALGVTLSLFALVTWGIADFLIQRSARCVGSVKTMLFVGIGSVLMFFPFVYADILSLQLSELLLLFLTGAVLTIASLFDFQALKEGKMAIAEPIVGLEMPFTVICAILLAEEKLEIIPALIIGLIFIGTLLLVTKRFQHIKREHLLEKGVRLALFAAVGLAIANFLVGKSSLDSTPFLAIWFVGLIHALTCLAFLFAKRKLRSIMQDLKRHPWTLISQSVVDNLAWIAYAGAVLFIPISIATAISSGYIAVAVILGLVITREKLRPHQFVGIALVIFGIIYLSYLYS